MVLTLIRGIPGSGKTTLARKIVSKTGARHFEADMYFEDDNGHYEYDRNKIHLAHKWCQHQTELALINGQDVVVSNTFTRIKEMQPYIDMADKHDASLKVITSSYPGKSIHSVPDNVIQLMKDRWEDYNE